GPGRGQGGGGARTERPRLPASAVGSARSGSGTGRRRRRSRELPVEAAFAVRLPPEPGGVRGVRPAWPTRMVLGRTGRGGVRLLRRERRRPGLGARGPVAGSAGRSRSPFGRRDDSAARRSPGGPSHAGWLPGVLPPT